MILSDLIIIIHCYIPQEILSQINRDLPTNNKKKETKTMMVMGKQHHVLLRLSRPKNRSGPIIFSLRSTNRDNKGVRTQTHVMEPYEIILNEQETDQGNV